MCLNASIVRMLGITWYKEASPLGIDILAYNDTHNVWNQSVQTKEFSSVQHMRMIKYDLK